MLARSAPRPRSSGLGGVRLTAPGGAISKGVLGNRQFSSAMEPCGHQGLAAPATASYFPLSTFHLLGQKNVVKLISLYYESLNLKVINVVLFFYCQ